ncbi:hypothetical protein FXN63_11865 [Pigmentiphaga aceris]|uniref:Uncharacterized protein n=1 Tax=Pigmentiphaga aceris TaxID=1940612 RepID=A0A5C0B009_9BURK|nr:hypothetical protein [Pigmentiphaga aceris]QEI06450.1 hypothetical protein FXN63_11865 [Pigmentiphaga aceris]
MLAHTSHPESHNTVARPRYLAAALAIALSSLAATVQAQSATSAEACPQPATILQNAYPAAKLDPDQGKPAGYLLGDHKLMLPQSTPGSVPFMFCKVWPAHDQLLLVGVPRMAVSAELDMDREGDLDILVLDRATLKVKQRTTVDHAMTDDAIRLEQMEFDTARYVLAPGIQAFGLRASYSGSSRPNPFNEVTLRLFAMRNGDSGPLRIVLDGASVSRMNGEWDTNCKGEFTKSKTVLSMTSKVSNGFFDIRATKNSEDSTTQLVPAGSDCNESIVKKERTQHTLVFDGQRYVIPDAVKAL